MILISRTPLSERVIIIKAIMITMTLRITQITTMAITMRILMKTIHLIINQGSRSLLQAMTQRTIRTSSSLRAANFLQRKKSSNFVNPSEKVEETNNLCTIVQTRKLEDSYTNESKEGRSDKSDKNDDRDVTSDDHAAKLCTLSINNSTLDNSDKEKVSPVKLRKEKLSNSDIKTKPRRNIFKERETSRFNFLEEKEPNEEIEVPKFVSDIINKKCSRHYFFKKFSSYYEYEDYNQNLENEVSKDNTWAKFLISNKHNMVYHSEQTNLRAKEV